MTSSFSGREVPRATMTSSFSAVTLLAAICLDSTSSFTSLRPLGGLNHHQPQQFQHQHQHKHHHRAGVVRWNVWSNPQAIEDYQNLLAGKAEAASTDQPSVIVVGDGLYYQALAKRLESVNPRGDDVVLEAGPGLAIPTTFPKEPDLPADPVGEKFPVYLCVGAGALPEIIDACPPEKRDDLVFLSDGYLEPTLKARGACGKVNTQAVLWLAFNQYGVAMDGRTSMGENANGLTEWAGETTVTGRWAG